MKAGEERTSHTTFALSPHLVRKGKRIPPTQVGRSMAVSTNVCVLECVVLNKLIIRGCNVGVGSGEREPNLCVTGVARLGPVVRSLRS